MPVHAWLKSLLVHPQPPGVMPAFPILDPARGEYNSFEIANTTFGASPDAQAQVIVGTATLDGMWTVPAGGPAPVNGSVTMQWMLDDVTPISGILVGPPFTLVWDSTGVPDGTHIVGARWIDSTDPRWPAYTLRTFALVVVVMNLGPVNGAQRVPMTGYSFSSHVPYPPATVDYGNYPGTPQQNTVHAYPITAAPASSSPSLRDSNLWYLEAINTGRQGLYEYRPVWSRTSAGGVFASQYYAESGDTVPSAYPRATHRLGLDGGRTDNTIDPYSAIVPAPDGSWTGVDLSGRVWNLSLTGIVTTLAGPKQNRALLAYDYLDSTITEGQLAAASTIVGTISGFGDFGGAQDLCYDPRNPNILYTLKTIDSCVIRVDLSTNPPAATRYAGQDGVAGFADGAALSALFDLPYSMAMAADGTLYVSDYNNSRIREVSPDGSTVSTLVGLQPAPTLSQAAANIDTYSSPTPVAFASAYTAFPGAIRFDSSGNLILNEPTTGCVRLIDLGTQIISRIGALGGAPLGQPSPVALWQWLAVDTAGACGPQDDILVMQSTGGRQQNQGYWRLSHDGSYSAAFADNGGRLSDGPRNNGATESHYPWMIAISRTEARMIATGFGTTGIAGWRPREPSDPPFVYPDVGIDPFILARGLAIWTTGTVPTFPFGSRPSFASLLGTGGPGQLGSAILPTFDDIAVLYPTDSALGAYIQAGMGGAVPRPEITGNDLRDLIYYIRRLAVSGGLPTTVNPGPDDPDTTAPVISNVAAVRLSSTSIGVSWSTNKLTIGLAAAGSPNAAATPTRYNVWSPIESGYGFSHSVLIDGISTATPTHYTVLAKDLAGNALNSADFAIA